MQCFNLPGLLVAWDQETQSCDNDKRLTGSALAHVVISKHPYFSHLSYMSFLKNEHEYTQQGAELCSVS